MRRSDRELSASDAERILESGEYGVLCTVSKDAQPYAVPISYAYSGGVIHIHCAKGVGKKIENISNCDSVCFTVVGKTHVQPEKFSTLYESVIVTGKIVPSENPRESLVALAKKYSPDFIDQAYEHIRAAAGCVAAYTIIPEHISAKGKREG